VGIDAATLKTLTFDETQQLLNKTFDGFIENQSETAAFKFQQLSIAIDETKEQVGAALLPAVTALTEYILTDVVPVIQSFVDGLTGANGLDEGLTQSQKTAIEWGKRVKGLIETIINFKDELLIVAGILATIFVANKIAAGVTATIALIKLLTGAYVALRNTALAAAIASRFAVNPFLGLATAAGIAGAIYGATKVFGDDDDGQPTGSAGTPFADTIKAAGGTFGSPATTSTPTFTPTPTATPSGITSAVASAAAAATTTAVSSNFNPGRFRMAEAESMGTTINLTVTGAFDKEGTARTIVDTLNNSFYRGTGGAGNLVAV
jgi:hypothetical protein